MAESAPKLFNSSSFPVLEVAATLDAPKTCFASCPRHLEKKKKTTRIIISRMECILGHKYVEQTDNDLKKKKNYNYNEKGGI